MNASQLTAFRLSAGSRAKHVAFVLSAAADGNDRRAARLTSMLQAAQHLPPDIERCVFFLGNPTRYSVKDLETNGTKLFAENQTRASLIAPVIHTLHDLEPITQVVFVGTKRVFDLGDHAFSNAPLSFMASGPMEPCRPVHGEHALVEMLHDPVKQVSISLANFAPTAWSNADYQFVFDDGQLRLSGSSAQACDVQVTGVLLNDNLPEARLLHASGKESQCKLTKNLHRECSAMEVELSETETHIMRAMVRSASFRCPYCGEDHASPMLHCPNDLSPKFRFHGRPLFPSLHGSGQQGIFHCWNVGPQLRCSFVGQSYLDRELGRVYFALDRQLYYASLVETRIDWTTWQRLTAIRAKLREQQHVFLYH